MEKKETNKTNKANKTISEKMGKLDEMVDWFYSDEFDLNEAEQKYKDVLDLSAEIEDDLDNLRNKIEQVEMDFTERYE